MGNKTEVGRRLALQLDQLLNPQVKKGIWSGPLVDSIALESDSVGRPYAVVKMSQAEGLRLGRAQGCVDCCKQNSGGTSPSGHLFEVANRRGIWLPASGSVSSD